jgi:uncharacterized protein (TIGR00369 family)
MNNQDILRAMIDGRMEVPPVAQQIGIRVNDVGDGRVVMEMDAEEKYWNPMKTVQGGVLGIIADGALGYSFFTTLEENETYTTVDLNIKFLKPVSRGKIFAKAHVVKRGKRLGYMECEVTNERGDLLAKATSTCIIIRQEKTTNPCFD